MKTFRVLWAILALAFASSSYADQTATVRLYCQSLRFNSAVTSGSQAAEWHFSLSTVYYPFNGELALAPNGSTYTHVSPYADLYDDLSGLEFTCSLYLNVPTGTDANGNGFSDFFEVSQSVSSSVPNGRIDLDTGASYEVQTSWSRNAGSGYGTCALTFTDPLNPFRTVTFFHTFQLIEYDGTLSYTPGQSQVAGSLTVTNNDTTDVLTGPLMFNKTEAHPTDELKLVTPGLTNSYLQTFELYSTNSVYRDLTYPTNYYGYVDFEDGNPDTAAPDYYYWMISIDDTNDTDSDGIPDFSDDVAVVPPNPPEVNIALGTTNVWLTLTGDVGRVHEIEAAGSLTSTNWTTVRSVTLTNSPQMESLPRPTETTFWRVRAIP